MKYGDEFAGHFVQGHVDTTIKVLNINTDSIRHFTTDKGLTFMEKRLSDGRGVRLNMDGTFKGFIDQN